MRGPRNRRTVGFRNAAGRAVEFLGELFKRLGVETWLAIAVVVLVFDRTGFIQRWFRNLADERVHEREQLSHDTQWLLERYQARVAELEQRIRERDEVIAISIRGAQRQRHGFVATIQYIAAARDYMRRHGLTPPPFDGWREMAEIEPEIREEITQILGPPEPKNTDEATC